VFGISSKFEINFSEQCSLHYESKKLCQTISFINFSILGKRLSDPTNMQADAMDGRKWRKLIKDVV